MLDPESPQIRIGHLRAAAHEAPITPADDAVLGAGAYDAAVELERAGELVRTPAGLAWRARRLAGRGRSRCAARAPTRS